MEEKAYYEEQYERHEIDKTARKLDAAYINLRQIAQWHSLEKDEWQQLQQILRSLIKTTQDFDSFTEKILDK